MQLPSQQRFRASHLLFAPAKGAKRKGIFLIEGTVALVLLVSISFVLLDASMNILTPRIHTMKQNLSDSYMSYETAYANRIDFDAISTSGEWPEYPASKTTSVVIGTLPGGGDVTGTVRRTRIKNTTPQDSYNGALTFTDLNIEHWTLKSFLSYEIGGLDYVKAITVVRSQ